MSIEQFINKFYNELPQVSFFKNIMPGQICYIPVLHINKIPMIMEVERVQPNEVHASRFKVRGIQEHDFKSKSKLPIKSISLRETEELIINKAKKRPAIYIETNYEIYNEITQILKRLGREHLQENFMFFVPIYSIETHNHKGGFPPEMVLRIKKLMYNQFFYCPSYKGFSCGVARLDRIQVIIPTNPINRAVIEPKNLSLTDEAYSLLLMMIRTLFGGDEEDLESLKSLLQEN